MSSLSGPLASTLSDAQSESHGLFQDYLPGAWSSLAAGFSRRRGGYCKPFAKEGSRGANGGHQEFLIDHPRLSMVLAHSYDPSLDLYKIEVEPDGVIHVVDPAGLAGDMELVNAVPGRRVYYISGHFDFLKMRFNGHMVLVMSYSGRPGEKGATLESTATSYIKVKSIFAGIFAKLMAFLFPKKVDERIGRFAHAVRKVAFVVHHDAVAAYRKLAVSGEVGSQELEEFAGEFL
jgi:hypothetical protein